MNLFKRIKKWYRGKEIPHPDDDSLDPYERMPPIYEPPLLAKTISSVIKFYKQHWKWIIGIIIALPGAFLAIVGIITILNQSPKRPSLYIELANKYLEYNEQGNSVLPYRLKNAGDITADNIKKGHMVFKLLENNNTCKHYYEPEHLSDTLLPGQNSAIHVDDIGKLNLNKSYKAQLVISFKSSEYAGKKRFYSLANLEFHPDKKFDKRFIIFQKSLREGITNEKQMRKSISNCQRID